MVSIRRYPIKVFFDHLLAQQNSISSFHFPLFNLDAIKIFAFYRHEQFDHHIIDVVSMRRRRIVACIADALKFHSIGLC